MIMLSMDWERLIMRGIYFNGLVGMDSLDEEAEDCRVFAKGISIACLRNFFDGGYIWSRYLRNMKIYIDIEKINMDFLKEYFGDLPACTTQIVEMRKCLSGEEPEGEGFDVGGKQGNVIALVSPFYAKKIEGIFCREVVKPIGATVCCGEGICGACSFDDEEGKTVHLCKARS